MGRPKVSVIIPVYNTEAYVGQAIQSVVEQDLTDFELLLVNDGSTDHSLDILQAWAEQDPRLTVISQMNRGLSNARNTGLSLAKGVYIYFMDSDDILLPTTLSTCYTCCEAEDLDFVFFDAEVFSDDISDAMILNQFTYTRVRFPPHIRCRGDQAFEELLEMGEFFSSVCLLFIKRELLTNNQLSFEEGIIHEDQLFTALVYFYAGHTTYIPERLFLRRIRPYSIMTRAYTLFNVQCYFTVGQRLLTHASTRPDHRPVVDIHLSQMLNAAIWKAYTMPLKNRLKIFWIGLQKWNRYIRIKTYLVLLFKKYTNLK